jgi:hypothetical protein
MSVEVYPVPLVPRRSSSPDERLRGLVAKSDDELPVMT